MFSRFFGFLVSKTFWVIVGLFIIALLIWFAGPLFAFAQYRPLEPEWVRWTLIGLLFGFFLLRVLFRFWRAKDINGRVVGFMAGTMSSKPKENDPASVEVEELRQRFATALGTLKKTRFKQENAGRFAWLRGKQYLYQLPWYVFIGAPGSGKTTALINSGLQFPLAEQLGKGAIRGVGGTRNCDWWFTNEAVLLDTAGRYTTQESNETLDQAEWKGFLGLLKKFRTRQPINGALLTISVADLLSMTQKEREQQAEALRRRLHELQGELSIRFPVYVLVTKCDLLAGFQEYFSRFTKEDRAQVWGFTVPFNVADARANGGFNQALFKQEFGALRERIYAGLPEAMLDVQDLGRKARIYSLPQHFAGLEDLLDKMLSSVFSNSQFEDQAMLRGVYFTSGTQEGSPFDRVLGALSRRFQVESSMESGGAVSKGKSFFLEDLLKKVIFAESHLSGRNFAWERKLQFTRALAFAGIAVLSVIASIGWAVSYRNNSSYIVQVEENATKLDQQVDRDGKQLARQLTELFPTLDKAREVAVIEQFPVNNPPLSYRFGLYQGEKLDAAAQITYRRLLEESLLPVIAKRMEEMVQNAPTDNPEFLYEALKSYLMLHDAKHYSSETLTAWIMADWERNLPPSVPVSVRQNLLTHLSALLSDHVVSSPFAKNDGLVLLTRQKLAGFTLAQRVYSRVKRRLNNKELPEFTIATAGGPQSALVFARKSNQPITRGIPALFTRNGYWELFSKEVEKTSATLAFEETWVMGEELKTTQQTLDEISQKKLVGDVKRLYMYDYIRIWEGYLNDIKLIPSQSLTQSVEVTRILSGPDSPLAQFLRAVSKETTLKKEVLQGNNSSLMAQTVDKVKSAKADLEQVIGPITTPGQQNVFDQIELIVDNRFDALHRLTMGNGGSGGSQLDQTLQLMNELYTTLAATDVALKAGNTPPNTDVNNKLRAEAARLPMPLRGMVELLGTVGGNQINTVSRNMISSNMSATVGDFCRTAIAGRYPIAAEATKEITPDDFGRMFAQGGVMDDFFQRNLAPIVDISKSPWALRPGASGVAGTDSAALSQFQKAQTIRDVFFRSGGRTPTLKLDIKTLEMDPALTQFTLDIDGQMVKYAHGPVVPVSINWPGPRGSNQVRAQVQPSGTPGVLIEGPWALYRLFDRMQISRGESNERFIATLTLDGRRIVFEVTASSVQNPFRLSQLESFQCPAKL